MIFQKRKTLFNFSNEYKEVELAIEKVKKQLYGKINNNQINEQKKDSRPKELIDLAGKYAEDVKDMISVDYTQNDDGSVYLSFTSNQTQELKYWIMSFGSAVKVLSPETLREDIKKELLKSIARAMQ